MTTRKIFNHALLFFTQIINKSLFGFHLPSHEKREKKKKKKLTLFLRINCNNQIQTDHIMSNRHDRAWRTDTMHRSHQVNYTLRYKILKSRWKNKNIIYCFIDPSTWLTSSFKTDLKIYLQSFRCPKYLVDLTLGNPIGRINGYLESHKRVHHYSIHLNHLLL